MVGNGITPQAGWDLNTLNLGSTSSDTINLNNGTAGLSHNSGSDIIHYDAIVGLNNANDAFNLTLDEPHQANYTAVITAATNGARPDGRTRSSTSRMWSGRS